MIAPDEFAEVIEKIDNLRGALEIPMPAGFHVNQMTKLIKRGDIIDVKITGIQPYGAFALLPDNSTGLIHISEISDKFVKSIASYVHINDIVKVKVIDFDHSSNHAKLSLKAVDNRFRRKDKKLVYKNPRKPIVETPKGFLPLAQAMEEWLKQGVMEEN